MRTWRSSLAVIAAFVLGVGVARGFAGGKGVSPSAFSGKSPKEAAEALLQAAEAQAGTGTWELIGVGRVYYLSGDKAKGQALFDRATSLKPGVSEWSRIGKVYAEAGEYAKAQAALEKAVGIKADDTALAELGVIYNLDGKRDKAEEMFRKSIEKDAEDVWNTLDMAGSYLGVKSQS